MFCFVLFFTNYLSLRFKPAKTSPVPESLPFYKLSGIILKPSFPELENREGWGTIMQLTAVAVNRSEVVIELEERSGGSGGRRGIARSCWQVDELCAVRGAETSSSCTHTGDSLTSGWTWAPIISPGSSSPQSHLSFSNNRTIKKKKNPSCDLRWCLFLIAGWILRWHCTD